MLQRVREQNAKKTFKIPKKGRIRLVLILIIGIFIIKKFVLTSPKTEPKQKIKIAQSKTVPDKVLPDTIHVQKTKKRKLFAKPDFNEKVIAELFYNKSPKLKTTSEVFLWEKQKVRLYYSIDSLLVNYSKILLKRYKPRYGAIVAIEPSTGRVLSMVSYTNSDSKPISRYLYSKSIFPSASVFKIVTATGAIEKGGLTLSSKLRTMGKNHTLYKSQLEKNPKVYRTITLRDAFAYSINPVFGRLGIFILGKEGLQEYSDKFGFNAEIPFVLPIGKSKASVGDSAFELAELSSGFNQKTTISPFFGALLASSISNYGKMPIPTIVDSVINIKNNEKIYSVKPSIWRMPCSKQTAKQVTELMKAVARYGTARKAFATIRKSGRFSNVEYGGKTGNVDKDNLGKVDWFVGFCRHKTDPKQHIAVGVVTVHGPNWTIHSSYVGAEIMRSYIRRVQIKEKEIKKNLKSLDSNKQVQNES